MIDRLIPESSRPRDKKTKELRLERRNRHQVAGVLALLRQVPAELISPPREQYSMLVALIGYLEAAVADWRSGSELRVGPVDVPDLPRRDPIELLREILTQCPDEYAAEATGALAFISDDELRRDLELDMSSAHQSASVGHWKAATVVAGSVTEALLLWSLASAPGDQLQSAIAKVRIRDPLEKLGLVEYLALARELRLISDDATKLGDIARGFRNLVHPGRAQRLGIRCDKSTALSALAAMERVLADLRQMDTKG